MKSKKLEKEYQKVEFERSKNLKLRKTHNTKVSVEYKNLAMLARIEEQKENDKSSDSFFSSYIPARILTQTTSTPATSTATILTRVKKQSNVIRLPKQPFNKKQISSQIISY